jgi:hypothetical protein
VVVGKDEHDLIVRNVVRGGGGDVWSLDVEVVDAGLRAELTVTSHYAVGFDDFVGSSPTWRRTGAGGTVTGFTNPLSMSSGLRRDDLLGAHSRRT